MKFLILLALGFSAVAANPLSFKRFGERIFGGSQTDIGNYPYAAALLYSPTQSSYWQACSGAIINNKAVLTAAHCVVNGYSWDPPSIWRIRVGSTFANSGGFVHNLQAIIGHPSYNRQTLDNDVVVLHTTVNFLFNSNVGAASIAGTNYNLADNQVVRAIGWGTTSIRHVDTQIVNQATCRTRYSELGMSLTDNMLCSGWLDVESRDQCQGNSGGPLIHFNILVGIYSWSYKCSLGRYPSVNTRVSRYATWIQNNA